MISVIIPAYNSARTIAATLATVCGQTFGDYEVLITDDGSSDGTLEICRQYAREHPEMQISIASIPHSGVAAARNHSLARASGDYVSFLDSDDRWTPEKLERVTDLISRNSGADVIYHDVVVIAQDGRRSHHPSGPPPSDPYLRLLLDSNFLSTSAVTVRRSRIMIAGGFDCNPDFEICEDYELWLRLARSGARFAYIQATLGEIVKTKGSLSSNVTRHMRNRLHVRRHCLREALDAGTLSPSEFKRHSLCLVARCQAAIGENEARQGHLILAIRAAIAAAGACVRVILSRDWEMTRQLMHAASLRMARVGSRVLRQLLPVRNLQRPGIEESRLEQQGNV